LSPGNTVYVSGPACSPEEAESMAAIATLLERSGFDVYLPPRDGIEPFASTFSRNDDIQEQGQHHASTLEIAGFALDIYQLVEGCDCLLFNMNGRVPDPGSAFRAAVAFTAGKPVVLFKRDHRTKLSGNDNAMISGLSYDFSTVNEPEAIPGEIVDAMRKAQRFETVSCRPGGLPPFVSIASALGQEVWKSLQRFKEQGPDSSPMKLLGELASICEASAAGRFYS